MPINMGNQGNLLSRMDRKLGKYAIRNLMTIIVAGMGIVFLLDLFSSGFGLSSYLAFSKPDILRGQIWRIVTFAFIPPPSSLLFILFSLYFYWLLGSALKNEWGAFKFNIFYFCGMLGTVIAGLITGYATNFFLNMSLFFAFAILFPHFELRLFFFIPIEVRYLAYLNAAYFVYLLVVNPWPGRVALVVSLLNIALFFGGDVINRIKQARRRAEWKRNFR
ncbi:MAG TPA: hypothetical protein DD640_09690 [Clostridiales bacterium]|nr:hypothetical protein [Clostridiales bacterium]